MSILRPQGEKDVREHKYDGTHLTSYVRHA